MTNFTQLDVSGILRAVPFFSLVFLSPGYCLGRASDVLGFRRRSAAEQLLWSMAISIVTVPITLNILSRWLPISATLPLFFLVAAVAAADLLLRWRRIGFRLPLRVRRSTSIALCLAALWAGVCLVSLPDLQLGDRLYSTAAIFDLGVRSAFVASAMHGGAPPANPFFYPHHLVKLRYFYYWYTVVAIPGVAARVEPRAALFASCIWSGWLLAAVVALFLKHFYGIRHRLRQTTVTAIALLGVTGLDALCALGLYLKYHIVLFNTETWDSDEVASWPKSLIWDPHHVAATCACMIGFVFLWQAGRTLQHSGPERFLLAVLAALGFASAAGLSVYVTFAFALFLVAAAIFWLATRRFHVVGLYLAVALLVLLLSAGYLHDLRATGASVGDTALAQPQQTTHFVKVALRQLPPTLAGALQRMVHQNKLANILLRPFVLVPIIFLEFGFFFLVAARQARHDWPRSKVGRTADQAIQEAADVRWISWLMLGTSLWVALMMRSTVISNNDLAFRGVEIAQFILLIWGAAQLAGTHPEAELCAQAPSAEATIPAISDSPRPRIGWLAASLLVLGLLSSAYQLVMLRVYLWGSDRYGWTDHVLPQSELSDRLGEINLQVRSAYAALDRLLPAYATVQFGAAPKLNLQLLYYSRYPQLDGMFPTCGTAFGGSEAECGRLIDQIAPIFGTSAAPPGGLQANVQIATVPTLRTAGEVRSLCRDLGIDALVVTGEDPLWADPAAWPSNMKPVYAGDFVAAYLCR